MPIAKSQLRTLELLSPARDADTAIAAIKHGADAVYIGAPDFGARSAATNSIDDIRRVVEAAEPFGVRVYVAFNTILYDDELQAAAEMINRLCKAGVDALIVQDPALLRLELPPIELHASTQWNSESVEKIEWLSRAGFTQVVVPREFSLDEIRKAAAEVSSGTRLEAFVHGALCVSHSGGCHAGEALAGRSANRGRCPQVCRLEFTLTDKNGRPVAAPDGGPAKRHWLSLADMNRLTALARMADAGVDSFKIEGRLKPVSYVKNVTAAYSQALDKLVAANPDRYRRQSWGKTEYAFAPSVEKSFNRGFTQFMLTPDARKGLTSWTTPKWIGLPIGTATAVSRNYIKFKAERGITLQNGDGLGWHDRSGRFHGFRANRVDGDRIYYTQGSDVPDTLPCTLYRNADTAHEALMARNDTARRTIGLKMTLRMVADGRVVLDIADERGLTISAATETAYRTEARSKQLDARRSTLSRLGDTVYRLDCLEDSVGDIFIPAKDLTALRRRGLESLDKAWHLRVTHDRGEVRRRDDNLRNDEFAGHKLDFRANVANKLAREFYESHGAEVEQPALEVEHIPDELLVMTSDYCLRRELGACLKVKDEAGRLPRELWLDAPIGRLRLDFDCANCRMKVFSKCKNN